MNTSIHHSEEISKRLSKNNLLESVKTVSEPYVVSIIMSMFQTGYRGKTVDMESCSDRHRTSISRFLRNESINDDILESSSLKNKLCNRIKYQKMTIVKLQPKRATLRSDSTQAVR